MSNFGNLFLTSEHRAEAETPALAICYPHPPYQPSRRRSDITAIADLLRYRPEEAPICFCSSSRHISGQ